MPRPGTTGDGERSGEQQAKEVLADMPPRPANYETIIDTNLGRGDVTRADVLTMELGPNNCAASEGGLDQAARPEGDD